MGATPLRALIGWVLVALMLVSSGCDRLGRQAGPAAQQPSQPLAPTAPRGALQEVAPPPLVQQLKARLDRRNPQVSILAPADGALLPAGPWTLELQVEDWPLADAGRLGLGPHLVVQLDGAPPLRISDASAASHVAMPALTPGSHRLTVYAARPWGEVVKSPGASRQIRLDRVAANPQQVPGPGSPQLLAALASPGASKEPVLIDWLLLDAPLQHLRDDDGRWRLRVSVNGDSFLVDRQTPLWLQGFHGGSNAVQLELLDGRGEPLNPPFNSLVEEVVIQPGAGTAWQRPSLTALEQAQLLGEAPPAPEPRTDASPVPPQQAGEQASDRPNPASSDPPLAPASPSATNGPAGPKALPKDQPASGSSDSISAPGQAAQPGPREPSQAAATAENSPNNSPAPEPAPGELANAGVGRPASPVVGLEASPIVGVRASPTPDPAKPRLPEQSPLPPTPEAPLASRPVMELQTAQASAPTAVSQDSSRPPEPTAAPGEAETAATEITAAIPPPTAAPAPENGRPDRPPGPNTQDGSPPQARAAAPQPPDRLSPSTSLTGRARDQVAADGSLLKPRPEGPLARLRQRFQP